MAEFLKQRGVVDNVVNYRLFPQIPTSVNEENTEKYLQEQLESYLVFLSDLLVDYIWQHESFRLGVIPASGSSSAHLSGSTNFGDNIEDEWFIVYILRHLTSLVKELIVQISDNDGEFLLIETADALPDWLEPDTAENRVFVYNGKLHIIPQKENISNTIEALHCVRNKSIVTEAHQKVQKLIDKRLSGFPEKAKTSIHHANCYIPASLAAILNQQPTLVAPIVQSFYYRDPVDLQACVTFKHFRPGTRVIRRVKMTRCQYAQLQQQQFESDKRSGYVLPAPSHTQYKAHQLGMKLAHGAEILCSKCGGSGTSSFSTQHPRWKKFLSALSESGYFQGQLEGSKLYCKLLADAENFYKTSVTTTQSKDVGPGETVLHLLKTLSFDVEELRKEEKHLPPEDDDSWIELTPEHLESMMRDKFGEAFTNTDCDLGELAGGMKSFINKESSHQGAEFPNRDEEVEFDSSSFIHTMQKMFEFQDDHSSSSNDMSEYGSDDDPSDLLSPSTASHTSLGSHSNGSSQPGKDSELGEPSVSDYMDMMDRELKKTTISESFVKEERPVPPPRRKRKGVGKTNQPTPNSNNGNTKNPAPKASADDIDDLEEDFQPVNVNLNLVSNLLESYSSQEGLAGPTSNILGSMGVHLPPPDTSDQQLD